MKGLTTPLLRWFQGSWLFVQVLGDLCVVSYWIDTLVLKTMGNTYATLLHQTFLFKGKPTHAQEVARRISGTIVGEMYAKSRHNKYPSQNLIPRITLFAICLSFSSPPLHLCRFIRPFSFASCRLLLVCPCVRSFVLPLWLVLLSLLVLLIMKFLI